MGSASSPQVVVRSTSSSKGAISIFIILGIFLIGGLIFGGVFLPKRKPIPQNLQTVNLQESLNPKKELGLQLKTLSKTTPNPTSPIISTPAPTSTPKSYCDSVTVFPDPDMCTCKHMEVECRNKTCIRVRNSYVPVPFNNWKPCSVYDSHPVLGDFFKSFCGHGKPEGGYSCVTKPVIYLYPTKKTLVNVSVETSGQIVVSDPLYPEGGWKNVTAYPDGNLTYQNKNYRELFYETNVKDIKEPTEALVVAKDNAEKTLDKLVSELGLIEYEKKELLDWWVPQLKDLDSPYIFMSILDRSEKERADKILISPKPDTFIDFILYFKPLKKYIEVKPLRLPPTPKRIGFTAVEWGGTIDYK